MDKKLLRYKKKYLNYFLFHYMQKVTEN